MRENLAPTSEIEKSVLGGLLLDNQAIPKVAGILDKWDFYNPAHQETYDAIVGLYNKNEPADLITVSTELKGNRIFESNGGDDLMLMNLTTTVATSANVEYHAHIVLERSMRRQLVEVSMRQTQLASDEAEDLFDTINGAIERLAEIRDQAPVGAMKHVSEYTESARELLANIALDPKSLGILKFGFIDLDGATGGCLPGNLIIIAGKRKSGKTTMALQVLFRNAKEGIPSALFSQEMTIEEVLLRMAFVEADANLTEALNDQLSDFQKNKVLEALESFNNLPLYVSDRMSTVTEIAMETDKLVREKGVKTVVVDYIQITRPPSESKANNREQEVAAISGGLKRMAKMNKIVVFALSQLNENNATRESRGIENDADKIIYIDAHEDEVVEAGADGKVIDLKILQRFGLSGGFGEMKLWWKRMVGKFTNYTPAAATPPEEGGKEEPSSELPF